MELGKINTSLYYIQELPLSGQFLFVGHTPSIIIPVRIFT
nr:MAG TPA: hypothetical protein [Caudoviricetes sp.]